MAGINSLTEPLSNFVDFVLRPLVTSLPSYLRDTRDFLQCLSVIKDIEEDIILATMDVSSLYTNIPHTEGLLALKYFLDLCSDNEGLPTKFIVDMAELVLTKNYFLFEKEFYLQIEGTAMGATIAPDYANLGYLEDQYIFNNNTFINNLVFFKRYIDDCFIIYKGSACDFEVFALYMNCLRPSIEFTYHVGTTDMIFFGHKYQTSWLSMANLYLLCLERKLQKTVFYMQRVLIPCL